jgi:hypothetical protein
MAGLEVTGKREDYGYNDCNDQYEIDQNSFLYTN